MANDVDIDDAVKFVKKYFLETNSARLAHKRDEARGYGVEDEDHENSLGDAWSRAKAEFIKRGQVRHEVLVLARAP